MFTRWSLTFGTRWARDLWLRSLMKIERKDTKLLLTNSGLISKISKMMQSNTRNKWRTWKLHLSLRLRTTEKSFISKVPRDKTKSTTNSSRDTLLMSKNTKLWLKRRPMRIREWATQSKLSYWKTTLPIVELLSRRELKNLKRSRRPSTQERWKLSSKPPLLNSGISITLSLMLKSQVMKNLRHSRTDSVTSRKQAKKIHPERLYFLMLKRKLLISWLHKSRKQETLSRRPRRRLPISWLNSIKKKRRDREEQNKQQLLKRLTNSTNLSKDLRQSLKLQRFNLLMQRVQRNGSMKLSIT